MKQVRSHLDILRSALYYLQESESVVFDDYHYKYSCTECNFKCDGHYGNNSDEKKKIETHKTDLSCPRAKLIFDLSEWIKVEESKQIDVLRRLDHLLDEASMAGCFDEISEHFNDTKLISQFRNEVAKAVEGK